MLNMMINQIELTKIAGLLRGVIERGKRAGGWLILAVALSAAAEPRVLVEWNFKGDGAKPWSANFSKNVRVENGVLKGEITGWDPFVASPVVSIDATAGQAVELRVRTTAGGNGNLYWVREGESAPQGKFNVPVVWIGDNAWHEYRVLPYWQGEKKIAQIRIDFASPPNDVGTYEVEWVRVTETQEKAIRESADATGIVAVELSAKTGGEGSVLWASDAVSGLHKKTFRFKPDGRSHIYNVDVAGDKNWQGNIVLLDVRADGDATVRSVKAVDEPQGDADVSVLQVRPTDALNRAGRTFPLLVQFSNTGGKDARNVTLAVKTLPPGVRIVSERGWEKVPEVPASGLVTHTLLLMAERAVTGEAVFTVSGDGAEGQTATARLEILPDLKLAKAAYVPEPKPLKSGYEIGALYYPGWQTIEKWARIWPVAPERKPVLGWYDEANPEVVDWQIKWAVENGLSYFLVDWYWHKGRQYNDHWVKAFQQARYRSYLKWAVMWANHNAAGSHSEEDQRAVTKFWIENYFNTPEYYRINGQPVVMIWSAQNMNRDMGGGDGCKRLLDISRKMAVDAGYQGITFIAMKWPEASWEPKVVQGYKDMGFDMTSIYHYMHHGGKAENPRRFSFKLVADSNYEQWKGLYETDILPFLPNLSTGWDDRPWHGDRGIEIYGRTVEHFRRICRDAKRFADETGVKRLTLAPLNEWGEGSYAEPNAEFGFGMYEAVREAFCERPTAGWPLNYGPQDVGLGPYDLPPLVKDDSREWTFAHGAQGWSAIMGIEEFKAGEGGLTFKSVTRDPAIVRDFDAVPAKQVAKVVVRMQVSGAASGDGCQLFWQIGATPASEETALRLPVTPDGQFRDYVFEVGQHRRWRGRLNKLRFDPINQSGASVTVESIRLIPALR